MVFRAGSLEDGRVNVDSILAAFNETGAEFILIGGMNFLLNHKPILTFDVDLWVDDNRVNLTRVNLALRTLQAEWGITAETFSLVPSDPEWLERQMVFCLYTPAGDLDIFRAVRGLDSYAECRERAAVRVTPAGTPYRSLSDIDMLACQLALEEEEQKLDRIRILRKVLGQS